MRGSVQLRSMRRFAVMTGLMLALLAMRPATAANGSVAYTYDALGRVTTSSYDTGVCVIYTYDANGNRLSQTVDVNTGNAPTWGTGIWGCFQWTAQ